jgi:ATP-dependent Lon protease
MPISVNRPRSTAAIEAALASEDKTLIVVTQRNQEKEDPGFDDFVGVGTLAVIKRMQRSNNGIQLIVQGGARARIEGGTSTDPYLQAKVALLPDPSDTSPEVEALTAEVIKLSGRAFELLQPETQIALPALAESMEKPIRFLYFLGGIFSMGTEKEQALLEAATQAEALRIMHEYLTHQVQVLELRQQIASQAETKMSKQQREYVLRHQLEAIQKELGEESGGEAEATELRRRVEEAELPEAVRKEIEKELKRLERMSPAAPDYQVSRTYIDLVLDIPWKTTTEDKLDLQYAREVLDEDHYGLEDVKDRILEHLAVMKMNPQAKAPILCFVGPPGVGKTSLGQ